MLKQALQALGFPVQNPTTFERELATYPSSPLPRTAEGSAAALIRDESGAQILVITDDAVPDEPWIVPVLQATGGHRATARKLLDGAAEVVVHRDADEGQPAEGLFALIDHPEHFPSTQEPAEMTDLGLGVLVSTLRVYGSHDAWHMAEIKRTSRPRSSPQRLISPAFQKVAAQGANPAEVLNPEVIFGGECVETTERTNTLTGEAWFAVQVDCGLDQPVTVALPGGTRPKPRNGFVLEGVGTMTASSRKI